MKEEARNFSIGVTLCYYCGYFGFYSPSLGLFTLATSITKGDEVNFLPLPSFTHSISCYQHK